MTLQPTSKAHPAGKQRGLIRHQMFNFLLAFPLILLGASFIFYNKASHNVPHFTTWHSVRCPLRNNRVFKLANGLHNSDM